MRFFYTGSGKEKRVPCRMQTSDINSGYGLRTVPWYGTVYCTFVSCGEWEVSTVLYRVHCTWDVGPYCTDSSTFDL